MSLHLTLILFLAAGAATGFFAWRGAQPPNLVRGPRMIPYRFLMVLGAAATVALLVHLVNLAGFQTGQPR